MTFFHFPSAIVPPGCGFQHPVRAVPLSLLLAALLPGTTLAQTPPTADRRPAARFDTQIVVTPERGESPRTVVPASTVVLDATDLPGLPVVHPSELLQFLPGFNVAQGQFHAGRPVLSARGFFGGGEAEYVLLLVDGNPVADVESGLIDWSVVPATSIARVEATRGPGASLYGDSAVGGVIQILTERRGTGELNAAAGSYRTFNVDGSYGGRPRATGFMVSGAARSTEGGYEHSRSQQVLGAGSADGSFRGFRWQWNISADRRERDDPGALTADALAADPRSSDPVHRFDGVHRRNIWTAFTLGHATSAWRPQARVRASAREEDLVRTILLAPGFGDTRARALSSAALGGSFDGERTFAPARPVRVRFGTDVARERLETSYREITARGAAGALDAAVSGRRVRTGLFASATWQASSRLRLAGGARWDNVSDSRFGAAPNDDGADRQRAWSPRAGLTLQLTDNGSVVAFAQFSRAFKVPTLDQLFDPRPYPDFMGGTFTISNPRLVPQRATNVEAGLWGGGALRWSALAYRMAVEDEIDFDVRTFSYANIRESRHMGLEFEAEARWWTSVRPSIVYAHSRVASAGDDRQLKNVPRHVFRIAAHGALPFGLEAYGHYSRSWGAFLDDENVYAIDGRSTFDLRLKRVVGRYAFFFDALNVTDDTYAEYGFTLPDFAGGSVPYAYAGAPRALRGGFTVRF